MSFYSSSHMKTSQFKPPRPIDEYPEESLKKIAVLFTDIIGSTKFFKARGNLEGRKMLGRHQDMASPAVLEHGGVVVKILGDSVMAYFFNAREALKSAIKIQQKFQRYNQKKDPKDQIHIRICINFGDGIVEEKDIYGDVVNIAAKFLPLVEGDQISVSQEVYNQVRDLKAVQFKSVNISSTKNFPQGLTLYRVLWDETINLNPITNILLYLKPIWELGDNQLAAIWDRLLRTRKKLWEGKKVEKESILSDKSIVLILTDVPSSLALANNVLDFFKSNTGENSLPFIPIQIVIDAGPYLRADKLALDDLKVNWEKIEPGEIFVSASVNSAIKNSYAFPIIPTPDTNQVQSFHKITSNYLQDGKTHLFLYQNSLIQGENAPCFYCGDRRHLASNCPSKQLYEISHTLDKLGYLSLDEINNLFFNYLTETIPNSGLELETLEKTNEPTQWALLGFYELKAVFQLRFFRNLWNVENKPWNQAKEMKVGGNKGGLLWMAQDCLRVSDLDQAESILKTFLEQNTKEYKAYCALGFLNVEKKDFLLAKHYFDNALDNAKTETQKIYVSLILSRLYELSHDPGRAEETIRKILHNNPLCLEALYQDVIFRFRKGDNGQALQKLNKLIENDRQYYINALIDPELADFSETIHPQLKNLYNDAMMEAARIVPEAEEELEKLKKLLGQNDEEVEKAQSFWLKVEELSTADSYFGYLDILHYGNSVVDIGHRSVDARRKKILKVLKKSKYRLRECLSYIKIFPYPSLIESVGQELKLIQAKIDKYWKLIYSDDLASFKEISKAGELLSSRLDQIESKLRKLESIREWMLFLSRFFKSSLIFQSGNLVIALILFPILSYYVSFLLPQLKISPLNIWAYQKTILILGGISALLLAIVTATKKTGKR